MKYRLYKDARDKSGAGWDDAKKVVTGSDSFWDNLVRSAAFVSLFLAHRRCSAVVVPLTMQGPKYSECRTKPFPWYDDLTILDEGKRATGENAFTVSDLFALPSSTPTRVPPAGPWDDLEVCSASNASRLCATL